MQELQLTNQMEIIGGGVGTWIVFQFQDLFLLNGDNR